MRLLVLSVGLEEMVRGCVGWKGGDGGGTNGMKRAYSLRYRVWSL